MLKEGGQDASLGLGTKQARDILLWVLPGFRHYSSAGYHMQKKITFTYLQMGLK